MAYGRRRHLLQILRKNWDDACGLAFGVGVCVSRRISEHDPKRKNMANIVGIVSVVVVVVDPKVDGMRHFTKPASGAHNNMT